MRPIAKGKLLVKNAQLGSSTMTWNLTSRSASAKSRIKSSSETAISKTCSGILASTALDLRILANPPTQTPRSPDKGFSRAADPWGRLAPLLPSSRLKPANPRTRALSRAKRCWSANRWRAQSTLMASLMPDRAPQASEGPIAAKWTHCSTNCTWMRTGGRRLRWRGRWTSRTGSRRSSSRRPRSTQRTTRCSYASGSPRSWRPHTRAMSR